MNAFHKLVARILIVTITCLSGPMMQAQAGIVSTDQVGAQPGATTSRATLETLLARDDVRSLLQKHGVSYEQAKSRVAALSDEEAATMAAKLDSLPAGGDGILGTAVFIFIVLLITDILGFTKVFSFTRSIK